jgi:hypothetical protein
MDVARMLPLLARPDYAFAESHWFENPITGFWTTTATDSGAISGSDDVKGVISLTPSDGTVADNDEIYLLTPKEIFKFANDKSFYGEIKLQYAEANTDDLNLAFGFLSAVAANAVADDGAGIRTSGSGVCIYKVDGGTKWVCVTMQNGTQTTTTSASTAGGSAYQTLAIQGDAIAGYLATKFYLDGVPLLDTNSRPIVHNTAIASATEMHGFVGMKNGAATNVETVLVDRMHFVQAL